MEIMDFGHWIFLILGFLSGTYGIMVGAGGGFIFVPALLIILNLQPQIAAGTGLAVVLLNSLSGVFGYVRQKRIDYNVGLILSLSAIPGIFLGIYLIKIISPNYFNVMFGILLLILGVFLIFTRGKIIKDKIKFLALSHDEVSGTQETVLNKQDEVIRKGNKYNKIMASIKRSYSKIKLRLKLINKRIILYLSLTGLLLGVISSFFGIGGGWLLVPVLVYLFRVQTHIATGTSIFTLCLYSIIGVMGYVIEGSIQWNIVIWGGFGALLGAQLGVYLSKKIKGNHIIQMLSLVLICVGGWLIFK